MSERNLNNQTVSFEPSGIDDLYVNAAGVGALSLDEEPMVEPARKEATAEAVESAEEGPFAGSQTSDNRGYVKLGATAIVDPKAESRFDSDDAPEIPIPAGAEPWDAEEYLTDEEALLLLAARNSGVCPERSRRTYRVIKRIFDVVASGLAIALLAMPSAALCAVICLKSPGANPIYFQWRIGRVGKDGSFKPFKMFKFRSMVPNAEDMLAELQQQNEATGPMFKIKDDPRIIPGVGAFIRKHSIDELPQLLNVFIGRMSLIGPRPGLPREVALYDERAMKRLAVKPGCGGAWQVSGRSDLGFEEMVELDLGYIKKRSIGQDLSLILGTIGAMLSGKGAA